MVALGWAATRRASVALPAATAAPAMKVRRLTAWWGAVIVPPRRGAPRRVGGTLRASVGACQSPARTRDILRPMATFHFPVVIEKDEDGYFGYCPPLQGCYTQAETYEEVLLRLRD